MSATEGELRLYRHIRHLADLLGVQFRGRHYIHLRGVIDILRYLAVNYRPLGNDRLSLLVWMANLEGECKWLYTREENPDDRGFARLMELEISRIAGLPEPERTVIAVELVERVREARTLAEAWRKYVRTQEKPDARSPQERRLAKMRWWQQLEKLAMGEHVPRDPHYWPPTER